MVHIYDVWQDAIRSVSKEGRHLLCSLETSAKEDDSQWDVKLDWETVQRCVVCVYEDQTVI